MSALLFYAEVFLVLVAAASFAALLLALLNAPLDDRAVVADLPGGHQRARRAEHHHDKDVLHAQLALDEERAECV